jgi:predicted aminopeptidase
LWRFPLIGSFPYKGYFSKDDALAEAKAMEARGFDATVAGAAAYKTPLWISDPLPSTALAYSPGDLAALNIHELTHGTVFFKNQTQFDETLADFAGETGAQQFLAASYGAESKELADYRKSLDDEKAASAVFDGVYVELDALYKSSATAAAKLAAREPIFAKGLSGLAALGYHYAKLDNAVVLGHRVYHDEADRAALREAFAAGGRDWAAFIARLKGLDPKDPSGALRSSIAPEKK